MVAGTGTIPFFILLVASRILASAGRIRHFILGSISGHHVGIAITITITFIRVVGGMPGMIHLFSGSSTCHAVVVIRSSTTATTTTATTPSWSCSGASTTHGIRRGWSTTTTTTSYRMMIPHCRSGICRQPMSIPILASLFGPCRIRMIRMIGIILVVVATATTATTSSAHHGL